MAKENKNLVIGLLVVAGILLFLVGNYVGNVINWGSNTKSALTIQQKQEIFTMLKQNCNIIQRDNHGINQSSTVSCSDICKSAGKYCISGFSTYTIATDGSVHQAFPIGCDIPSGMYNEDKNINSINCNCCKA